METVIINEHLKLQGDPGFLFKVIANLLERTTQKEVKSGERKRRKKLTDSERTEIVRLKKSGVSARQISEQFGIKEGSVYSIVQKVKGN